MDEQSSEQAGSFTFSGLNQNTAYTVKICASNPVGRGNILTADVATSSGSSSGGSSSGAAYTVSAASKTDGGSVTVSPKNAKKGDTVTATVKPDSGYALDQLTVTAKNGSTVKLTEQGGGKYTFTMPASAVTVEASFVKAEQPGAADFTDVPANAYYADAVKWAVEKGITSGTSADTFSPNAACTRAQIVTFLYRAAN